MKLALNGLLLSAIYGNEIKSFEQWLEKYERNYESAKERAYRQKIWEAHFETITTHNAAAEYGNEVTEVRY